VHHATGRRLVKFSLTLDDVVDVDTQSLFNSNNE
jgi:hypothetical protein